MTLAIIQFVGGLVFLLGGAEIMVRGAVALAQRWGISTLVIGMTVVAMGTSLPEFLISLNAALNGVSSLAVGNILGSNIANILLILGAAGLVAPIDCRSRALRREGLVLIGGSVLFAAMLFDLRITRPDGAVLVAFFVLFLAHSYWRETHGDVEGAQHHIAEAEQHKPVTQAVWLSVILLICGMAGLIVGAEFLVEGGVFIARLLGVSEAVIGLTMIAFGTSVPELAASIVAAYRGHTDVALGNVVGSNLFNILGIAGVVSLVTPLDVPARVPAFDIWIMLAATLALTLFMLTPLKNIGRIGAVIFLLVYAAYILALGFGVDSFT